MFALAALHDWEIEALDVKTAFLFEELDKELYMVQPEGCVVQGQESKVCQLQKAIYSLKQAALQWNKQLHKSIVKLGFKICISDSGIYSMLRSSARTLLLLSFTLMMLYSWAVIKHRSLITRKSS